MKYVLCQIQPIVVILFMVFSSFLMVFDYNSIMAHYDADN